MTVNTRKQKWAGSCIVSQYRGVLRAEKLMNRSKTKGAAPASGAAAQVSIPGHFYCPSPPPAVRYDCVSAEHPLFLARSVWAVGGFSVLPKTWALGTVLRSESEPDAFHRCSSCGQLLVEH